MSESKSSAQTRKASKRSKTPKGINNEFLDLLPLNNMVGWPGETVSFTLQHEGLIRMVRQAYKGSRLLFTFCSNLVEGDQGGYFGTKAEVLEVSKTDSPFRFKLIFLKRGEMSKRAAEKNGSKVLIHFVDRKHRYTATETKAIMAEINSFFSQIQDEVPGLPVVDASIFNSMDVFMGKTLKLLRVDQKERFELLQGWSFKQRINLFLQRLAEQVEIYSQRKKLRDQTQRHIQKLDRAVFLKEEKRLIESELGESKSKCPPEFQEFQDRIAGFDGPEEVKQSLEKEFTKLIRSGVQSPQSAMIQDYIEVLLELPWTNTVVPEKRWKVVEKILNQSHFGLDKVKRRILEHLAVIHLSSVVRGSILCLVGPPGVGKTSVAKAMAEALKLPFVKKSLGGVHDESEIRGHRRTYIGALPGRIIQGLRRAGSNNPVFLLDEVDKMGHDHRGNPADALLEVLDPDENHRFSDHYLEIEYDLSKVIWVLTANSEADIPAPLLDRLEIIRFSGYSEFEKCHIARNFLLRRNLEKLGLPQKPTLSETVCKKLIRQYTREAGVRDLDRKISGTIQHMALLSVRNGRGNPWRFSNKIILDALGAPIYKRPSWVKSSWIPGVISGLAWTASGGTILRLEGTAMPGKKNLKLTGKMGEVMQESAHLAYTFIRRNLSKLDLEANALDDIDIHIHIPAGAVSKEGPSAGLGLALLIYSTLALEKSRSFWAITGEIALHGKVLAVGGIKEKILAAQQQGFEGVILPKDNKHDVDEISKKELGNLKFVFVEHFKEAYEWLFKGKTFFTRRKA